jgi:putative flippase GtrA
MCTKKSLFKLCIQLFKFGIVGGINTLTSLVIYYGLVFIHINYMVATVCGYIIGSFIGYVLNNFWVFQANNQNINKSLTKYFIVYLSSLCLNMVSMYLWVDILNISKLLAPILSLCVTFPYNFVFSKLWVFKKIKIKKSYKGESSNEIETEKLGNSQLRNLLHQLFTSISF